MTDRKGSMNVSLLEMCVWPKCQAAPTKTVEVPLCDSHAAKAYRRISEAMRDVPVPHMKINPAARPIASNARRNVRTTIGTVYFARIGTLVKIGFTTDLPQRMRSIRANEVLATIPGTMLDEEALHHQFGKLWVRGELFRYEGALKRHIDLLRAP